LFIDTRAGETRCGKILGGVGDAVLALGYYAAHEAARHQFRSLVERRINVDQGIVERPSLK